MTEVTRSGRPGSRPDELTARGARATATWAAYDRQWHRFHSWCAERGECPLPADPLTVARFLADLAPAWRAASPEDPHEVFVDGQVCTRPGLRPGTQAGYLAAISVAHQSAGLDCPTRAETVRRTMVGIRRHPGVAPVTRPAAAPRDDVAAILATLRPDEVLADARDTALLLIGWKAALRSDELARLQMADLHVGEEGLSVFLRRSKTDQHGGGATLGIARIARPTTTGPTSTPAGPGPGGATCSVATASRTARRGGASTATAAVPAPPGPGTSRPSSGCCSRWWPTGRWRRARSSRLRSGSAPMCTSRGWPRPVTGACYRAMDRLSEILEPVARQVFWSTATLLDLEVDLVFFDSTSTYFETETPDEATGRDTRGEPVDPEAPEAVGLGSFRTFGHSKDHREDRPQVVVGMAVTRGGIPIRCWSWPGNTADVTMVDQVRADLRDWQLARMVWVTDRGFASEHNRRVLRTGGWHYIQAERLRHPTAEAAAALARPGRYRMVAGNLRVKEVNPQPGDSVITDRFVVCHNPERATRDAAVRGELVEKLTSMIDGDDSWSQRRRDELVGSLKTSPGLRRYLRRDQGGRLRVDQATLAAEAKLDGKWLLRCSDPKLPAEDVAAGYKQLLEVERGWRDLKTTLEMRPVFHHREDRIRAHVQLCWLALLLIRVAETTTGQTWPVMRRELDRLHAGTFTGPTGTFRQRTELTKPQRDLFTALDITPPPQMLELTPTPR